MYFFGAAYNPEPFRGVLFTLLRIKYLRKVLQCLQFVWVARSGLERLIILNNLRTLGWSNCHRNLEKYGFLKLISVHK